MYQNVILTQTEHQQQCTLFLSVFLVYVLKKYSTTAISSCVSYATPLWTLQFSILFTKKISFSRWPLFGSRQDVLFKAFYLRQTSVTTAKVCKNAFPTHLLVLCVLIFWWKSSDNHNENLLRLHNFTHACTGHSNCGLAFNPWFNVYNCANFTFPCSTLFL